MQEVEVSFDVRQAVCRPVSFRSMDVLIIISAKIESKGTNYLFAEKDSKVFCTPSLASIGIFSTPNAFLILALEET